MGGEFIDVSWSFEVFDKYCSLYDKWYAKNYYVWLSRCLCIKLLGINGSVIDVGVGTGAFRVCMDGKVIGADPALKPSKGYTY